MIAPGLLPARHAARIAETRAKIGWGAAGLAVAAAAGILSAAVLVTSPRPDPRTLDQIEEQRRLIGERDASAAAFRAQAAAAARTLEARKAVGEHPDWGLLVQRLAGAAGPAIALEEVAVNAAAAGGAPPPAPGERARPAARGRRWVVQIAGLAPRQAAVGELVTALEGWKLFDKVRLVESKARTVRSVEAVSFRLEATIEEGRR